MAVYYCSGTNGCQRLISVTSIPGGNPAALADPEGTASEWTLCSSCRSFTCDRCLTRQQGLCRCGAGVRLYSEVERFVVAQGGPAVPATSAAAAPPQQSDAPLRQVLEGLVYMIETDLAGQATDRARQMAGIAATVMVSRAATTPVSDLQWYALVGEQFHRWRFLAEGAHYWKGLYQLATAAGQGQSDDGRRIMASTAAFQVLAGEITAASPNAAETAALVAGMLGPAHVLTQEVRARLGAPAPAVAEPPPRVSRTISTAASELATYDPATKNALWVTLAFMEMAMADGKVKDPEVAAWQRTMGKLRLPNVWQHFGTERLQVMLQQGFLAQLSAELCAIPIEKRAELAEILLEFMVADGKIDPGETAVLDRITGWLGVTVQLPGK